MSSPGTVSALLQALVDCELIASRRRGSSPSPMSDSAVSNVIVPGKHAERSATPSHRMREKVDAHPTAACMVRCGPAGRPATGEHSQPPREARTCKAAGESNLARAAASSIANQEPVETRQMSTNHGGVGISSANEHLSPGSSTIQRGLDGFDSSDTQSADAPAPRGRQVEKTTRRIPQNRMRLVTIFAGADTREQTSAGRWPHLQQLMLSR